MPSICLKKQCNEVGAVSKVSIRMGVHDDNDDDDDDEHYVI